MKSRQELAELAADLGFDNLTPADFVLDFDPSAELIGLLDGRTDLLVSAPIDADLSDVEADIKAFAKKHWADINDDVRKAYQWVFPPKTYGRNFDEDSFALAGKILADQERHQD